MTVQLTIRRHTLKGVPYGYYLTIHRPQDLPAAPQVELPLGTRDGKVVLLLGQIYASIFELEGRLFPAVRWRTHVNCRKNKVYVPDRQGLALPTGRTTATVTPAVYGAKRCYLLEFPAPQV